MQTSYNGFPCPADGEAIQYADGKYHIPDHPIIPFIEGDGTGRDIWHASQRVFDAAVEKAYGGKRSVKWFEIFAGEKAFSPVQELAAGRLRQRRPRSARLHQGTPHHARRRRHPLAQRGPAPDSRPLFLRAPGQVLPRRAQPGKAPGKARRRHLPREHRRRVLRHRVQAGNPRSARSSSTSSTTTCSRAARRRFAKTRASASSPSRSSAPSAWCATPSRTRSRTAASP